MYAPIQTQKNRGRCSLTLSQIFSDMSLNRHICSHLHVTNSMSHLYVTNSTIHLDRHTCTETCITRCKDMYVCTYSHKKYLQNMFSYSFSDILTHMSLNRHTCKKIFMSRCKIKDIYVCTYSHQKKIVEDVLLLFLRLVCRHISLQNQRYVRTHISPKNLLQKMFSYSLL